MTTCSSLGEDLSKESEVLSNIILYQKEQLIKLIAKSKGWDELELLNEFLIVPINDNNSNCENKTEKKRGRPKKTEITTPINNVLEKKKRGRPKKKIDLEIQDKPKRKRGRPKKIVEMEIVDDPNIDLEEHLQENDLEALQSIDIETSKIIQDEMIDTIQMSFASDDCIYSNSENEESDLEDFDELHCAEFIYKNKKYCINTCNNNVYETLINNSNKRYDVNETKFVGRYNEKTDSIDFDAIE